MSFMRQLKGLKVTSGLALVCVLYLVWIVGWYWSGMGGSGGSGSGGNGVRW
jgi:amino acid permease